MKLRRPSPALVISVTALAVACAGTAYAATIITSSDQIKNGVIQSGDIKNGSVQNVDIRKSTVTETRLSAGLLKRIDRGAVARAAGDSIAYEARRPSGPEGQPPNVVIKVASLQVPAGAYLVTAKTIMTVLPDPQDPIEALVQANAVQGGRCKLDAAGDGDEALQNVLINQRQTPATLTMQVTRTVGAPSEFTLECSTAGSFPWRLSETSIIAVKLPSVVRADATPK
ncbi:MAG: hypothetical protein QOD83_2946 [Solirubrobacteraceae bacterium]|nr:hypothetical protein [Solirubrobacteraceae bacterium]